MKTPWRKKQMIDEENGKTNDNVGERDGRGRPAAESGERDAAAPSDHPDKTDTLSALEQALTQAKDQLLRKAAEFDNYKKRMEAETGAVIRFANEDLLLRLLPVLDDFERSFKAVDTPRGADTGAENRPDAFFTGIELIYGKFKKILEGAGLKAFVSTGQPFDPELHDALLQVPRDDVPHHTVVEEIERGYRLNEKVFRHARVVVSSKNDSTGS